MIQPRNDRVLIERIEEVRGNISLTDAPKSIKGKVIAVGAGKLDEDGCLVPLEVQVGDVVLFNSKWNDLAGDHYDDLPLGIDPKLRLHLVQEADIIGILDA